MPSHPRPWRRAFIDLRDHYGLTQVVADPDSPAFKVAETLRAEWVVRIERYKAAAAGRHWRIRICRPARSRSISGRSRPGPAGELPMPVFGDQEYPEETRLKYRFLDLRREHLHQNIMKRGQVIDSIRRRMKEQGFFEFQTPILTASSPEGARDYLVPSRVHPGKLWLCCRRRSSSSSAWSWSPASIGLFPDRAVLSRRGRPRRPLARRVLSARSGNELRYPVVTCSTPSSR